MGDTPSLGETRAADVPPGGYGAPSQPPQPAQSTRANPYSTEARPTATTGSATSGGHFCGTCGARLESGTAFCGQCGTPVAASGASGLTFGSASSRPTDQAQYRIGGWSDGDGNELTEAIPNAGAPTYGGFGRSGVAPYHASGYGPSRAAAAPRSSNTTRLVVGVLCLIASIISASTAIILALTMSH